MKYIQGTIVPPLILSIDNYCNIKWYVDAESAMHKDMRIRTGGFMTMGTGGAYAQSIKNKLNTKSSTKTYLIIVENVLTQVIWT